MAGVSIDRARRLIERRQGLFDPLDAADRQALTASARTVFSNANRRLSGVEEESGGSRLERLLTLDPEGLPEGFITIHSGRPHSDLERQRDELRVVEKDGRWRLADVRPLIRDPLHAEVADLFAPGHPRRLLHLSLGGAGDDALNSWARERLDDLDGIEVRDLLSSAAPGALGEETMLLHAEACLSVLDLAGARDVLGRISPRMGRVLRRWMEAVDRAPDVRRLMPSRRDEAAVPRAAAEIALMVLRSALRDDPKTAAAARGVVGRFLQGEPCAARRWVEIERAALEEGRLLSDRRWRRKLVDGHPVLESRLCFRRALQLRDEERTRAARRLLENLVEREPCPGRRGILEIELGTVALDEGRSREADVHHLRAFRMLQAAGFRHLVRLPLFNLAVADLDLLRLDRAAARLEMLSREADDPFVKGELARLALATGEEALFHRRLAEFENSVSPHDQRFSQGLEFLRGAKAMFDDDPDQACAHFGAADQEGNAWLALAQATRGRPITADTSDGWGVGRAARIVGGEENADDVFSGYGESADGCLALALAARFGGHAFSVEHALRRRAIRVLRQHGLSGWARSLTAAEDTLGHAVEALARILEGGGTGELPAGMADELLRFLELEGMEVRDEQGMRLLWRCGDGAPGTEVEHGRLRVLPLGGEVSEGPVWTLLLGLLELLLPARTGPADSREVESTGFYGVSEGARSVQRQIAELAASRVPILVLGETGVGKEVVARGLHKVSGRSGAFVPVNVAAIPANLLEAELFGSVKGAFTGADRSRRGLAASADGGTLFLDEIGDLDPRLQVKLLRFLESHEVRPVGADHPTKVDVRVVSATHRDLQARIREGLFRQDLYFRIASMPIGIPPLRERREDILLLRDLFEREASAQYGLQPTRWSREAEEALLGYRWPGNVRELRFNVEVALIRAAGTTVLAEHLILQGPEEDVPRGTWDEAMKEFRRRFLADALRRNGGNRSATARELGISRQALLYHIRALGLAGLE
ncbi:MAG: sigma 54-interacting transcriptional regulator [Acidobacteriota bacterium]